MVLSLDFLTGIPRIWSLRLVPSFLHIVMLLLILLSIRYWIVLGKARSLTPVFEFNPRRTTLELSPPVLLALFWITYQLINSITAERLNAPLTLNLIIQSCSITLTLAAVLFLILAIVNRKSLPQLGFRLNDLGHQIREGGIGFLLALVPVMILLLATFPLRSEETLHPLLQLLKSDPGFATVGWIFLSAVVAAPLFEELVYRVLLQSWLEGILSPIWSILFSSLIFSVVHGFPDCIPLFPLAFLLGTLYYYRKSYLSIVLMHALFNAINFTLALTSQQSPA